MNIKSLRPTTLRRTGLLIVAFSIGITSLVPTRVFGATPSNDFSVEVSPSVLAATVKPNATSTLELKVKNASKKTETLKFESRSFKQDGNDGSITLSTSTPPDLADWISYSDRTPTIAPGEWFTQRISVNLPDEAGFSYPFAIAISRANEETTEASGRLIKGSVAVFALLNVDKPGASRAVEISGLTTSQSVYEFLPASIELNLHNRGNSIVQPYGNIFIQRGVKDAEPLAVMPLNDVRGYILPNTTREFTMEWNDGFPRYKTIVKDGKETKELVWDWDTVSQLRIGRYTAKVVAVYNDGVRDVPVIGEVSFWVIPWRLLGAGIILLALISFGIWSVIRTVIRTARRIASHTKKSSD
jgi:hypothetical protein